MAWLLVEDDNDIRNVVAVMMSVWGEKPLPFPDGTAAWAWLDSVANGSFTGELPDLALMDIRMPGYTGDKVAARIRQLPALKDIPIILMTAFSLTDSEIKEMMEQCGIDHLINKPLPDMEVFRTTLYRVRDERRTRAAKQSSADTSKVEAAPASTPPATAASPAAPASVPTPTPPAVTSSPKVPTAEPVKLAATAPAAPTPVMTPDKPSMPAVPGVPAAPTMPAAPAASPEATTTAIATPSVTPPAVQTGESTPSATPAMEPASPNKPATPTTPPETK